MAAGSPLQLLLLLLGSASALRATPALRVTSAMRQLPTTRQLNLVSRAEDEDTAGVGFGTSTNADVEARGRKALEKLRAASSDRGYDSSLQGLQTPESDIPVEVPQEVRLALAV